MSERCVLITGAGGFVCRHIAEALLTGDWHVYALDRAFDTDLRAAWADKVELIEGDTAELPDMRVDALVHGAAITASPDEIGLTPEAYLRTQLDPALDALAWAHTHRVEQTLVISSDAVLSFTPPGLLDEDAPTRPQNVYGVAKVTLENLARILRDEYERDIAVVRLGNVYGPGELPRPSRPRISRVGRMIHEALTARRISFDTFAPARSWTFAPDIGAAVRALLEAPKPNHDLYNVATHETLSPRAIAEAIHKHLPDTEIVTVAGTSWIDDRKHTLSHQRLYDETGFDDWTPFADGIAATIAWQRAQLEVAL
ncbi:MAG: NAD(P)-dependent oxidoreductase [Chloroflexota bacterium]|nr:NAD(P)-dependent oxidoreductase [Chloroflexota bacterium]